MKTESQKKIQALLAQMNLDEKVAQLGAYWIWDLQDQGRLARDKFKEKLANGIGQITRIGGGSAMSPTQIAKAGNQIQKFLVEETRLGIPAIFHEETCAGTMVLGGSVFPQPIGLAATFEPRLAEEMTRAIRKQMLSIGGRQALAPVLDLGRDPRWGRIEETFGEDPYLVSRFGVGYVRGLQGEDLSQGVMATGKHFIGHSLSLGGLNCAPVYLGWNTIYDLFLAPFQAAITEAGLASVMNSYPELDGEVVAASPEILTDILRGELGFDGVLVSDYEAIAMIHTYHYIAETKARAASLALQAGIDVELPTVDCYGEPLRQALEAGDISIEMLDLAVSRHLTMKHELGLFENPYVDEEGVELHFETKENRALAREIAAKGMVLLKNQGLLPLEKTCKRLAVIGPVADDPRNLLGDYSHEAKSELVRARSDRFDDTMFKQLEEEGRSLAPEFVTYLQGLKAQMWTGAEVFYAPGCDLKSENRAGFAEALKVANQADVVVLVLGDSSGLTEANTSGETRDSATLKLPGVQEDLALEILALGKPTVLVLATGRPYAIADLAEAAGAVLQVWIAGEEGGNALADVLLGITNPSGRLPVTFPRSVGQLPMNYDHKPSGQYSNWYENYTDESVKPLYAFGHGLSYTQFAYRDLVLDKSQAKPEESLRISLSVQNSGQRAGEEVVQLYIRDEYASSPRPLKQLRGFVRVGLEPGETKQVHFDLPINQLAFYGPGRQLKVEAGSFKVMVAAAANDVRLEESFEVTETKILDSRERVINCPAWVEALEPV